MNPRTRTHTATALIAVAALACASPAAASVQQATRTLPASILVPWQRPDAMPYFHKAESLTVEQAQAAANACRPHFEKGEAVLAAEPAEDGGVWVATRISHYSYVGAGKEARMERTGISFGGFYVSPSGEAELVNVAHEPISHGAPWQRGKPAT